MKSLTAAVKHLFNPVTHLDRSPSFFKILSCLKKERQPKRRLSFILINRNRHLQQIDCYIISHKNRLALIAHYGFLFQ